MIEQRTIGTVTSNFLSADDFIQLCERWLTTQAVHHVVTLNPEMVMQAEKDIAFRQAIQEADLRLPDGAGIIWARWYLRSSFWPLLPSLFLFPFRVVERITGVDTVLILAELAQKHQKKIYLLGGTPRQAQETARKIKKQFPQLTIITGPPHTFSLDGPAVVLDDIKKQQPDILLVAYGSPKQTLWIEHHRAQVPSVRIAVGVGGAFAILSEEKPRAPRWLRLLNLEWVWRLILEPHRLPRIWQAAISFPLRIRQQKLQEQKLWAPL
jgi:N-acetylglucosaminyldiphosphoundecaprenol N-acetyl-beta-D-mannosaminyltransferase